MELSKNDMATKLPDVWRVSGWKLTSGGVFAAFSSEAYLLIGPPHVLIDCGSQLTYQELLCNLDVLGIDPRDISLIIATHSHWDHIGAAAELKANYSARFAIHTDDAEEARAGFHDDLSPDMYGPSIQVDVELRDGDIIQEGQKHFRIFHVPGHNSGSICILTQSINGAKLLFTGDVVHGIFSARGIKEQGNHVYDMMVTWAEGLERLLAIDFDYMFEGHVMPLMENISILGEVERREFVDQLLLRMDSRRRGAENGKNMIRERAFLLRQGFLYLPDYYISEACMHAGEGTDTLAQK